MSEAHGSFHMAGPDTAFGVFTCTCGLTSNPILERKVVGGPLKGECSGCGAIIRYGTRDQLAHESESAGTDLPIDHPDANGAEYS